MNTETLQKVLPILEKAVGAFTPPIVTTIAAQEGNQFHILISTLLSLRTKDSVTQAASHRLFQKAADIDSMLQLSVKEIEAAIYPVGFYRTKAQRLLDICLDLKTRFQDQVPDTIEDLVSLKGVGRKTANLVVTLGFNKPGICVDTHVHRISNRLGYVKTKQPNQTEMALRKKLPSRFWISLNDILVTFGQNICLPISPKCSNCPVGQWCDRVGVKRSR